MVPPEPTTQTGTLEAADPDQMARKQLPGGDTVVKSPSGCHDFSHRSHLESPDAFRPSAWAAPSPGEQSALSGHHATDSGAPPADRALVAPVCLAVLGRKEGREGKTSY